MEQLERDAKWLENHNICDYSLLIGLHFLKKPIPKGEKEEWGKGGEAGGGKGVENRAILSDFKWFEGGMLSHGRDEIYFVGIIDTLTEYNLKKAGIFIYYYYFYYCEKIDLYFSFIF